MHGPTRVVVLSFPLIPVQVWSKAQAVAFETCICCLLFISLGSRWQKMRSRAEAPFLSILKVTHPPKQSLSLVRLYLYNMSRYRGQRHSASAHAVHARMFAVGAPRQQRGKGKGKAGWIGQQAQRDLASACSAAAAGAAASLMSMRLVLPWLCVDSMPGRAVASLRKSGLMLKPACGRATKSVCVVGDDRFSSERGPKDRYWGEERVIGKPGEGREVMQNRRPAFRPGLPPSPRSP